MVEHLDLLEQCREAATQELARHYNQDVKTREFGARGLVLRKAVGNMRDTNAGKLAHT